MSRMGSVTAAQPWARAGLGVMLLMAASLGTAACGITADESPRDIPDNAVPEVLRGPPDTAVPETEPAPSAP